MEKAIMKPDIGTKVYCIYRDGILVDKVAFLGNESFLIESFGGGTYEDSWEWNYEDYGIIWFTDLEKAKEKLLFTAKEKYEENLKIEQTYDDWYEVVEIDE